MKRLLLLITLVPACGFIEGFSTPHSYFPDREACPPHFATHFASYLEAREAVASGQAVRRHSWLVPAPGDLCINGSHASKPFLYGYNPTTQEWGLFLNRDGVLEPWTPTAEDKAANDWESA